MKRALDRAYRVSGRLCLAAGQPCGGQQILDRSTARRVHRCHDHTTEQRKENLGEFHNRFVVKAAEDER